MMRPEFIAAGMEDFGERSRWRGGRFAGLRGDGQAGSLSHYGFDAPFLQGADQVIGCKPVGGEGETALGPVQRTDAVHAPDRTRQLAIFQRITLAPPAIPELTDENICVG